MAALIIVCGLVLAIVGVVVYAAWAYGKIGGWDR